jgi:hypothetical protein
MTAPRMPAEIRSRKRRAFSAMRGKLRKQIIAYANARYGVRLPDDEHGRAVIRAMIATGTKPAVVLHRARWARREIGAIMADIDAVPLSYWNGARLGRLIKLTDIQRTRWNLWQLRPCDVRWVTVQDRVSNQRRQRENERRRAERQRTRLKMETALIDATRDERMKSLLAMLEVIKSEPGLFGNEATIKELAARLVGGQAWRDCNGRVIQGKSLQTIIRRIVDDLHIEGAITVRTARLGNGKPVWFLRLKKQKNQPKKDGNTVTDKIDPTAHAVSLGKIETFDGNRHGDFIIKKDGDSQEQAGRHQSSHVESKRVAERDILSAPSFTTLHRSSDTKH